MGNGPGHLSNYTHRLQSSLMKRRSYHLAIESDQPPREQPPSPNDRYRSPNSHGRTSSIPYVIPSGHGRAPRASYDVDDVDISQEVSAASISEIADCSVALSNSSHCDATNTSPLHPTRSALPDRTGWRNNNTQQQLQQQVHQHLQRIQELETELSSIQSEMKEERQKNERLEAENQQLTEEKNRLQEECNTAATRLKQYTEWFFNTIDKQ